MIFCCKYQYFRSCDKAILEHHSRTVQPVWYGISGGIRHDLTGVPDRERMGYKMKVLMHEWVDYYKCTRCEGGQEINKEQCLEILNQMYDYWDEDSKKEEISNNKKNNISNV